MLGKQTVIDQIEIIRDGHIQIREANLIIENGVEIAKTYHRHVLSPGSDTANEHRLVKDIAAVVWTPKVVSEYRTRIEEQDRR